MSRHDAIRELIAASSALEAAAASPHMVPGHALRLAEMREEIESVITTLSALGAAAIRAEVDAMIKKQREVA